MNDETSKELMEWVKRVLSGMSDGGDEWRAIWAKLDQHWKKNCVDAVSPGLSAEDRAYNAGRAAGVFDVMHDLKRLVAKSAKHKVEEEGLKGAG